MISEQIKKILVERFSIKPELIHPEANLQDELNLDSMDAIDLLLAINEVFAIRIPEQSLEKIQTVSDLVNCIAKYKT